MVHDSTFVIGSFGAVGSSRGATPFEIESCKNCVPSVLVQHNSGTANGALISYSPEPYVFFTT